MRLPSLPSLPQAPVAEQGTGAQSVKMPAQVPGTPAQAAATPAEPVKKELPPIFGLPGMIPLIPEGETVNPQLAQLKTIFDNSKIPSNMWHERVKPALDMQTLLNEQTRTALNERITAYNEARQSAAETQALVDIESKKPLNVQASLIAMNQIAADFAQRLDPSRNYLAMGKSREDLYIAQAKEKRLETLRGLEQNAQRAYNYAARMGDQIEMAKASRQLANAQSQINTVSSTMTQWFTAQDAAAKAAKELEGEFQKIRLRATLEAQNNARQNAGKLSDTQEKQISALDRKFNADTQMITQRMASVESNMTMDSEQRAVELQKLRDEFGRAKAKYDRDYSAILGNPDPSIEQSKTADSDAAKLLARRFMMTGKNNNERIADIKSELENPESELWNNYREILGDDTIDTTSPALRRSLLQSISAELREVSTKVDPLLQNLANLRDRISKLEYRKRQYTVNVAADPDRGRWRVRELQQTQTELDKLKGLYQSTVNKLKTYGIDEMGGLDPDYRINDVDIDAEAEDAD